MSLNVTCYATIKLFNAKGDFVKREYVEVPLLQTPPEAADKLKEDSANSYFDWVMESYHYNIAFASKHCRRIREMIDKLERSGYKIIWGMHDQ